MQTDRDWILVCLLATAAVVIGAVAWRGLRSPVRPILVLLMGWRISLLSWRRNALVLLGLAGVVGFSAGLQWFFTHATGFDTKILLFVSVGWQGCTATLVAALVVPLQLSILHRRGPRLLMLRAAGYGLGIWLAANLLAAGSQFLLIAAPAAARLVLRYAIVVISFLALTLLSLVRPVLAMGSARPLRDGIAAAARNAPALYLMTVLLSLFVGLVQPWLVALTRHILGPRQDPQAAIVLLLSLFTVFQTLALEAATVLFARRAMRQAPRRQKRRNAWRFLRAPAWAAP
jgi:hypothetical protein